MSFLSRLLGTHLREYVPLGDGTQVDVAAGDVYLTWRRNDPEHREWQQKMREIAPGQGGDG